MIAIITSLLCSDILGWMKTPEKIMNKAYIWKIHSGVTPCAKQD